MAETRTFLWSRGTFLRDSREIDKILGSIRVIETDDDWDGISSAVQIKRHYPQADVRITGDKHPPSDITTLVLDKGTTGDGWVVDHHPTKNMPKNVLSFSEDGTIPTSSQVCSLLPTRTEADIFIAATAEITEGLGDRGMRDGAMRKLVDLYPYYLHPSRRENQFFKKEEIYTIADVLAFVSNLDKQYSFQLGMTLSPEKIKTTDDLLATLDPSHRLKAQDYLDFISRPTDGHFKLAKLAGHQFRVANSADIPYPLPALGKALLKTPGNYILLNGRRISVRTHDQKVMDDVVKALGTNVQSSGGRVGWHGITLSRDLDYRTMLMLLGDSQK